MALSRLVRQVKKNFSDGEVMIAIFLDIQGQCALWIDFEGDAGSWC